MIDGQVCPKHRPNQAGIEVQVPAMQDVGCLARSRCVDLGGRRIIKKKKRN